uniref:Uncharacterized protein n=1 Tax=Aegilops tauschii TaxID=37682 RepID=R7W990_AEGTA
MSRPAATLLEELLMEILEHVPYHSLCCFRCVSPSWHALCSDPGLLRRSPQTLAGFFCGTPHNICNDWTVLPHTEKLRPDNIIRLGFDPADPSCFVVFVIVLDDDNAGEITEVEVYLSENRTWTSKQTWWAQETRVHHYQASDSLFMNGTLHLITNNSSIVTVDTGGKTWRKILRSYPDWECIGRSRRCLHIADIDHYNDDGFLLSVWVLEDASGNWTLKHIANLSELIGRHIREFDEPYRVIAIHPDCDLFFLVDKEHEKFMLYDIDSRKVNVVYSNVGHHWESYRLYTPCLAEWLSDGN